MRILVLLLFLSFLCPAWADIQFEEVSQHAGITRIGEAGAMLGETLMATDDSIFLSPVKSVQTARGTL